MSTFTTVTLPCSGQKIHICEMKGKHFFAAMSASKGDNGLMIKHLLIQCCVDSAGQNLTAEKVDEMSIRDVSYLTQIINIQMENQKHTPEPWGLLKFDNDVECICAEGGKGEYIASIVHKDAFTDLDRANAARIVACVNACAGLSEEVLEKLVDLMNDDMFVMKKEEYDQLKAERDRLQGLTDTLADEIDYAHRANEKALAKIAELESQRDELLEKLQAFVADYESWNKGGGGNAEMVYSESAELLSRIKKQIGDDYV